MGLESTVDWDFIASKGIEGEATHKTGYVPTQSSGFTVGSVDLAQHSREDIRTMLQRLANLESRKINNKLLQKLEPYTKDGSSKGDPGGMAIEGRYGTFKTRDFSAKTVDFEDSEIKEITKAKRASVERSIAAEFNTLNNEGGSNREFQSLDRQTKTILTSIAWQYGANRNRNTGKHILKEFWEIKDNKKAIANKLKGMGDREYKSRRYLEADYILGK